ncbi:hypothetical protein PVT67_06620 [Gallaecimonas kandeliae]|uniref:hypothetical protein n=1 Tax=Gallaecimonas kandeliae TaxID=3029055 RepID=UPI00264829E2|nr:hypothetical protein [Gallaecimonas kandeliae]WKE66903.1 hypothetical protein PVT67_06620 [Gallaecimonas kandeliae]
MSVVLKVMRVLVLATLMTGCAQQQVTSWQAQDPQAVAQVMVLVAGVQPEQRLALEQEFAASLSRQGIAASACGDKALALVEQGQGFQLAKLLKKRGVSHTLLISLKPQDHADKGDRPAPYQFAPLWVASSALLQAADKAKGAEPLAWQFSLYEVASSRLIWASRPQRGQSEPALADALATQWRAGSLL